MVLRCAYRPVTTDSRQWASLFFGRSDARALRLSRLRGKSLAQSMSAELLCRELLAELRPGEALFPEEDDSGKPFLPRCPLFVSLSHSGNCVSAAVADAPVGIDLQELRGISPRVLRRCCSPEERRWIEDGNTVERAVRLWTMKEAYGKLTGTGIFRGECFHAEFDGDRLIERCDGVSFLFPAAPEGFCFTVSLAEPASGQ